MKDPLMEKMENNPEFLDNKSSGYIHIRRRDGKERKSWEPTQLYKLDWLWAKANQPNQPR